MRLSEVVTEVSQRWIQGPLRPVSPDKIQVYIGNWGSHSGICSREVGNLYLDLDVLFDLNNFLYNFNFNFGFNFGYGGCAIEWSWSVHTYSSILETLEWSWSVHTYSCILETRLKLHSTKTKVCEDETVCRRRR